MRAINIFIVCLFVGSLFIGCLDKPLKVKGGTLEIIGKDTDVDKDDFTLLGVYPIVYGFDSGVPDLVFAKEYQRNRIEGLNISYKNRYYFILTPATKFDKSLVLKSDDEEFPSWNLKLEFTEKEESIIVHQTYRILTQDGVAIKEIISSYKDKPITMINVSGYRREAGKDTGHDYSVFLEGEKITQEDVEHLLNYLLSLDYTNENYEDTMRAKTSLGLALEEDIKETKHVEFKDGSTFEVHIDSYSGLETGIITMPEGTFMFSK